MSTPVPTLGKPDLPAWNLRGYSKQFDYDRRVWDIVATTNDGREHRFELPIEPKFGEVERHVAGTVYGVML